MLHRILTGLWRPSGGTTAEEARTSAGSTRKSHDSAEDLWKARVSLYAVNGTDAVELLEHATLHFDSSEGEPVLVVRGYLPLATEAAAAERHVEAQQQQEKKKAVEQRFPCAQMCRVRHHRSDMFQWRMALAGASADSAGGEEYGLLFEEKASAWVFDRLLLQQLCSDADELSKVWGSLAVYVQHKNQQSQSQLVEIAACVECRLLQRPHTLEGYLVISHGRSKSSSEHCSDNGSKEKDSSSSRCNSSSSRGSSGRRDSSGDSSTDNKDKGSRETGLWYVSLSYGEYISTDPNRGLLQWWGPGPCRVARRGGESEEEEEEEAAATAPQEAKAEDDVEAELEEGKIDKHMFQLTLQMAEGAPESAPEAKDRATRSGSSRRKRSASRGRSSSRRRKSSSSNEDVARHFFLLLHHVMLEGQEGTRISPTATGAQRSLEASLGYDDEAFDTAVREEERENEMEWADAAAETQTEEEEDERIPVVSEDPTREVWRKSPQAMLYRHMNVGRERTFVFRQSMRSPAHPQQNNLQVFGLDSSDRMRVVATIEDDHFHYKKEHVSPVDALLHDAEKKLLVVGEDRESVYMLDVEKEKIVQKWETNDLPIGGVMPSTKDGQRLHEPTFMAHSPQALFCMDTRMQGAAARTNTLLYSSKVNFTCGATDAAGHIAAGNAGGEIRLYDGVANAEGKFNRAKTRLRGLGDPLLHISVLKDGSWVLGTCQRYLILLPVKLANSGKTGFVTALGEKQRPPPIILRLRLEDMAAYNLQELYFSKAEFDEEETTIVTFTNNLVVIWDFVAVKKGNLFAYAIKKIQDYIKDAAFAKTSAGEAVVMATPSSLSTRPLKRRPAA